MKKYQKAGLLILTLVIPALVFTFLRFFATNHYDIPFYHPVVDADGKIMIDNKDTLFYTVGELNAKTANGDRFPEHPFKRKLTIVNYQPDVCEDSCQIVQSNLERIQGLRKNIQALHIVTICDSVTGFIKESRGYKGNEGWIIAKVKPADLQDVLNETLKFQTKVPDSKTNSPGSKLMLIDKEEHIRGYYNGFDPEEINRLMAEIKILDFEKGAGSPK